MDDPRYVGTREAAQLLDVGESTVKRWADRGVLPVHLTAGKHRKIRLTDLARVARELNLPRAKLERLLGLHPGDPDTLADRFHDALVRGDGLHARTLLRAAHEAGLTAASLGDGIVAPAMRRIGHGWEAGELDIYREHAGTQLCLTAVQGLHALVPTPEADAPLALGGGPEGDPYLLANVLVELTLLEEGWRAENIGPNTPLSSLARAVRERRPRLVWVSCSFLADAEGFVAGFAAVSAAATEAGAALTVGGRALGEAVLRRITFMHHAESLADLAAYARELRNSIPQQPA